jgi:serine/threonine protein kinase
MPPEFLKFKDQRCGSNRDHIHDSFRTETYVEKSKSWSIDVWSLGIIVLEIVHGCPVWMPSKCLIRHPDGNKGSIIGLLGEENRSNH